jgi:hypothetical protein
MLDFARWSRDSMESLSRELTQKTLAQRATIDEMTAALKQCLVHIEADEETHGRLFAAGIVARAALANMIEFQSR